MASLAAVTRAQRSVALRESSGKTLSSGTPGEQGYCRTTRSRTVGARVESAADVALQDRSAALEATASPTYALARRCVARIPMGASLPHVNCRHVARTL